MITAIFEFDKKIDLVIIVRNGYVENEFSLNKEKLNELYLKIISNFFKE